MVGHVGEGLLGDPVQDRLLGSGQPHRQVGLEGAGDPRLLLEAGGVVTQGRGQPHSSSAGGRSSTITRRRAATSPRISSSSESAANTAEQVDHLLTVLAEVDDRFGFRRPHP
jgi:hypothetical protein